MNTSEIINAKNYSSISRKLIIHTDVSTFELNTTQNASKS